MDDNRVSFDLDGVIGLLRAAIAIFYDLFRPVMAGIEAIAGEGPIGLLIVFVVFFAIYLARTAAKTKNSYDFGVAIMGVGRFGMAWTIFYAFLLFAEAAILPLLVFAFIVAVNSVLGHEPGIGRVVELFSSGTSTGARIIDDVARVYADPTRHVLPLGWRATMLIFACFGCMNLVGRALVGAGQNP